MQARFFATYCGEFQCSKQETMDNVFVDKYCEFPAVVRRPMWKVWHRLMILFDRNKTVNFMNYGYQDLNGKAALPLSNEDESDRYCIQLYDHVAGQSDLEGKDVAEVGSGRGGGASYLSRYYRPRKYTGLDISESVIRYCNRFHKVPGLTFKRGFAEKQPFEDRSFDVLINVESARCYNGIRNFFREVFRVLRPGGEFLFADIIKKGEVGRMRDDLLRCGFSIVSEIEITQNVVKALVHDHNRRENLIRELVPGFLKRSFAAFAGTMGSNRYESFASGKLEYWSFVLKRPALAGVKV